MPPDPSIALEAITVLDGSLNVHPTSYNDNDDDDDCRLDSTTSHQGQEDESYSDVSCTASHPTNIFINGYQSWSFTGSVTQGDEQPKSAMPEFLSKAFNYGADIPPRASSSMYRYDEEEDEEEEEEWIGNERGGVGAGTEPLMRRSGRYVARACPKDGNDACNFQTLTDYKSDFFTCVSCMDKEDCTNHDDTDDNSKDDPIHNCMLDENGGPAMVLGFLSQRRQYGLITFDSDLCCVAMHASCQRTIASKSQGISTDWAYCQILPGGYYDEEPMAFYLNAVSAYNVAKPFQNFPPLTGWCSWYHYYENIDSESLNSNFKRLKDLNSIIASDAVIIDDGYITAWGDWDSLKPKSFPKFKGGMKHLADEIRKNGMTPGLWIAPFACDKHSKLAKEHPDWIIRNDEGRFANSSNCGKFFYGLDATNPAVREYAFKCIRRAVKEWGFRVLKLDFLYAACLQGNGKYDITMTRAETMYLALQTLRAAAGPDTFIIGCGCPIGPAIGLIDANRVSADTGPTWYPDFPLPWWDHGTLPSLRAMVRNTVTRSSLGHRFWHNDPDCILLGNTTRLTKVEIISAATIIAMTGGMLLLSDDLSKLESDRLKIATRIYPVTGVTAVSLDLHNTSKSGVPCIMRMWCTDSTGMEIMGSSANQLTTANAKRTSFVPNEPWMNPWKRERNCLPVAKGLGTWSLVSLSNWLDEPAVASIPMEAALLPKDHVTTKDQLHLGYHVFNFWSEKYHWVAADQVYKTISKTLEPHQSEIFHVKPMSLNQCQYIGSDLHFTCGFEVEEFISTAKSVQLKLRSELKRSGFIYLYIPCYADKISITSSGSSSEKAEVIFQTPKIWHNQTFYGGQVIRIWTKINADGSESDGRITVQVQGE
jgi:alpha-galactosidase